MLTRAKKKEIVKTLNEKLKKSQAVFVISYHRFTATESNEIRKIMKLNNGEFRVVKNTLFKIASKGTPFEKAVDFVEGPTALVFAYDDPVQVAKLLKKYLDEHNSLQLKGFVIEGKPFESEKIAALSAIPPKEVLLAQMLGTLQAPISNFVGVLAGILRKFLYVLKAIEEKKKNSK